MNVLLISECDKRALVETRRILDQFAERRGRRTWQTPITNAGLETLRKLLRRSARKNTAVACYWIRGIDRTDLMWIVGDRSRFNARGVVPTNVTARDLRRHRDETTWRTATLIRLLADLAALLHDLGKATSDFQRRLCSRTPERNVLRHEWISVRLFAAFVGSDNDAAWLNRLANPQDDGDLPWRDNLQQDGVSLGIAPPLRALRHAPLARALAWLVVSHHRLPVNPLGETFQVSRLPDYLDGVSPSWNESAFVGASRDKITPCWEFTEPLPVAYGVWQRRAARVARGLLELSQQPGGWPTLPDPLDDPFVMHLSRLCLMLADHHYSALEGTPNAARVRVSPTGALFANTRRSDRKLNQPLGEHLIGVARSAADIARYLPTLRADLPALGRHQRLVRRAQEDAFRWQDSAADMVTTLRGRAERHGAFLVNMASTGTGKTIANARMMHALAQDGSTMRCTFALGLRTLTLQTGQAFEQLLHLSDEQLAVRVGGSASRKLFDYYESTAEQSGSASRQRLSDEDGHVVFGGSMKVHPLLEKLSSDTDVRAMLAAPILVCTIDHLAPATEGVRGGRQIAPMLRLLTSDLVLDEPDDFDVSDLPALTRLVNWAGMLGARVLLSSATLPPALVAGLFEAYRHGRMHYVSNCVPDAPDQSPICCAWVDEFSQESHDCSDRESFEAAHRSFAGDRSAKLGTLVRHSRRMGKIIPVPSVSTARLTWSTLATAFAQEITESAVQLHHLHYSVDPLSGRRVSFGLVRFANITPIFEIALALFKRGAPANTRIHLCVYHSRHPAFVRSSMEAVLDRVLDRKKPDAVFRHRDIRRALDANTEEDHVFVVLASPVSEVGRDHDYDWAIVEPSSMRSLIQLGGRVRRHRPGAVETPNIWVFDHNLRHLRSPAEVAFTRPGFEAPKYPLTKHDLNELLRPEELLTLDSRPRIGEAATLMPREKLADLEHIRLRDLMLPLVENRESHRRGRNTPALPVLKAATWWHSPPQATLYTAVLQKEQPFRRPSGPEETIVQLWNEDAGLKLQRLHESEEVFVDAESMLKRLSDNEIAGERIHSWATCDYASELTGIAERFDLSMDEAAKVFGTVTVPSNTTGWRYHPALGFSDQLDER